MRRSLVISLVAFVGLAALALGATLASHSHPELGLDLQGGASVVLQPKTKVPSGVLNQAIAIIRQRVDALGVSEPDITRQGRSIIVQLPGVRNQQRALQIVGQTAELRFRPVLETLPAGETTPTTTTPPTTAPGATTIPGAPATTVAPAANSDKTTPRDQNKATAVVVLPEVEKGKTVRRYRLGPAEATGRIIKTARAEVDPSNGEWRGSVATPHSRSPQTHRLAP